MIDRKVEDYQTEAVRILAHNVQQMLASDLVCSDEIVGCSENDIRSMENSLGVKFPAIYREFLKVMGANAGGLFQGDDYECWKLLRLRSAVAEHLEKSQYKLASEQLVFMGSQGCSFLLFGSVKCADPEVLRMEDLEMMPTSIGMKFSEWLNLKINDELRILTKVIERADSAGKRSE